MKAIRTEAQFTGFRARVDGSIGFSGCTPEMTGEEKVALFDLQNVVVELLIYPKDEKGADLVKVKKNLNNLTPSQELRNALWKLWREQNTSDPFEVYYKNYVSNLTAAVLQQLEHQ